MDKCVLCNSKSHKELFVSKGKSIVQCVGCGLVKTNNFARPNYSAYHRDSDYTKYEQRFRNIFRKRFNIASKFIEKPGKILDIGCSIATLLDIFKLNKWETWGIEPSASYKIAQKKGHKVLAGKFESATLPDNYFDLVTLNHTLEHMGDPLKVLTKVNKILKKGGFVLVDVPNFSSLSSVILKSRWIYLLPNEHKYHFTQDSLSKILDKSGFKVIHVESRSGIFEFADPIKELINSFVKLRKSFITDLLGLPGAIISTLLQKGTSITIVAKKS